MNAGTAWLTCGVVRAEMEQLLRLGRISGDLLCLDSMLHMVPQQLESALTRTLESLLREGRRVVLVYGDCCAGMLDLARRFGAGRINAINCAQLLLGRERYRQLMHEEAFLVLPEWAQRWESIMKKELGLSEALAQDLMGEHRGVLVYLDTALVPVPEQALTAFSSYAGLPWRSETVALEQMLALLLEAQASAGLPRDKEGSI